jgi:NADPH:quinone reductase-like Zn-dependent oxidoreductase
MYQRMNAAIDTNHLHPVIDSTFPLTQAHQALAHLQSGNHFGKIVLNLKA